MSASVQIRASPRRERSPVRTPVRCPRKKPRDAPELYRSPRLSSFDSVDAQFIPESTAPESTVLEAPAAEAAPEAAPQAAAEPTGPSFAQLGLPQQLVGALARRGISH